MEFRVMVEEDKCVGCGNCTYHCPKAGKIWEIKEKAVWCENGTNNIEYCHRCTYCVTSCPQKAITIKYHEM